VLALEASLKDQFEHDRRMFDKPKLIFEMKVVVIATSISDATPFLFFNYNGTSFWVATCDRPRFKRISSQTLRLHVEWITNIFVHEIKSTSLSSRKRRSNPYYRHAHTNLWQRSSHIRDFIVGSIVGDQDLSLTILSIYSNRRIFEVLGSFKTKG